MSSLEQDISSTESLHNQPVILVITRSSKLTEGAMNYSLNVAGRLHHGILVAYVNTMPFLKSGPDQRERFSSGVGENIAKFIEKDDTRTIPISHVKESGKIGKVVGRLCRIVKKINLVIVDEGVRMEEVVSRAPVPVFNVDISMKAKQY